MSKMEKVHAGVSPKGAWLPDFASILIVENRAFDRRRLHRLIATLDIDTHIADADGMDAMAEALRLHSFDLILLDDSLPDADGLQALDAVRLSAKNSGAATVLLTTDAQANLAVEALRRGCGDYVKSGDLTEETFKRAVINALQKSHLSRAVAVQDNTRRQLETVLRRLSEECAQEISPMISDMARHLRDWREEDRTDTQEHAAWLTQFEQSNARLNAFLADLAGYQGHALSKLSYSANTIWAKTSSSVGPAPHPVYIARTTPNRVIRRPDR